MPESLFLIKLQAGLQVSLKRDPGTGVFFEFCEISKNIFSYRTSPSDCFLTLTLQQKLCIIDNKVTCHPFLYFANRRRL